jgi:hypothetical protein
LVYLLNNLYSAIGLALLFVLRPYLGRYAAFGCSFGVLSWGLVGYIWAPRFTTAVGTFGGGWRKATGGGQCLYVTFVAEGNGLGWRE